MAALVAVVGSGMVFLYVKGADDRAMELQQPVKVLKAVAQIEPGETLSDASAAGKIQLLEVPMEQRLEGAMTSIGDSGEMVALTRIFPNEQITASKFGSPGEQDTLIMPPGKFAVSVNLSDTGRVSGFVSPGSEVALFLTGPTGSNGEEGTRVLIPKVQVVAVGQTTMTTSTTTSAEGDQTVESLPLTLFTLAVDQTDAEKVMYGASHGELSFGLLNDSSKVKPTAGITQQNLFR